MPGKTHYSVSGAAPALCGEARATVFTATVDATTCTRCRAKLGGQTAPQPFTRTNK